MSMNSLELLIGYSAVSGLTLSAMLLYILFLLRQNHRANLFLSMFILCISTPFLISIVSKISPHLGGILFCLSIGITSVAGAFIYLYVSMLSGDIEKIGIRHAVHFLPMPVLAGLFLVMFPSPGDGPRPPSFSIWFLLSGGFSLAVPTVYSFFTFLKIRSYSVRVENWFSDTEKVSMSWLKRITLLSLLLFGLWTLNFIVNAIDSRHRNPLHFLPVVLLISFVNIVTAYHVIRQPEIFKAGREMLKDAESKEKYAKQSIDEDMLQLYLRKLVECMETKKPFLDEDITIGSLAEMLDIPLHHLSIVINSMLGKNFSTFINEYRIKEAVSLLDGDKDANILSVAFMSGFSSKSSFNTTFKRVTGKTPSEYRLSATA